MSVQVFDNLELYRTTLIVYQEKNHSLYLVNLLVIYFHKVRNSKTANKNCYMKQIN